MRRLVTTQKRRAGQKLNLLWLVAAALFMQAVANAQYTPMISGGVGFLDSTNTGAHFVQPVVAPLVAAPIGAHLLAESRFDFREFVGRKNGTSGPYEGTFFKSTQYLQLDYIAAPRLTLVVGRFLTPFGTYNERLTPIWIQNFQDAPMIAAIGTRTTGSSDGVMLRGTLDSSKAVHVAYVGYFSALSGVPQLQSARTAGYRFDFYFPATRVEIGTSYGRFLQGAHSNSFGAHFWWQPWSVPLQVRSEYAHDPHAQGYWLESGYRLSQWRGPDSVLGRLEPLFRIQQVFRNSPAAGDGLPSADTQQADFGFVYHFPHETRLTTSYSRKFSTAGNANIWDVALTYRFLFPMWRGKQ